MDYNPNIRMQAKGAEKMNGLPCTANCHLRPGMSHFNVQGSTLTAKHSLTGQLTAQTDVTVDWCSSIAVSIWS